MSRYITAYDVSVDVELDLDDYADEIYSYVMDNYDMTTFIDMAEAHARKHELKAGTHFDVPKILQPKPSYDDSVNFVMELVEDDEYKFASLIGGVINRMRQNSAG